MARREMSGKELLDQLYRGLDTVPAVETELDAHELLGLAPDEDAAPTPKRAPPPARRAKRVRAPLMILCGIAAAGTIAAAVLHQSEPTFDPGELVVSLPPPPPLPVELASLAPPEPQVVLTNPFDPTEKFTFPPGTSRAEAREQMANLLLQRAAERGANRPRARSKMAAEPRKPSNAHGS